MPKPNPLLRTSITIPADVLAQADRLAEAWDRSRSWVLAEAVRRMSQASAAAVPAPAVVQEPIANPYAAQAEELEAVRLRRLDADLRKTPEERLREAEELVQLAWAVRPARWRRQIASFDSYEDYDRWKAAHQALG